MFARNVHWFKSRPFRRSVQFIELRITWIVPLKVCFLYKYQNPTPSASQGLWSHGAGMRCLTTTSTRKSRISSITKNQPSIPPSNQTIVCTTLTHTKTYSWSRQIEHIGLQTCCITAGWIHCLRQHLVQLTIHRYLDDRDWINDRAKLHIE